MLGDFFPPGTFGPVGRQGRGPGRPKARGGGGLPEVGPASQAGGWTRQTCGWVDKQGRAGGLPRQTRTEQGRAGQDL